MLFTWVFRFGLFLNMSIINLWVVSVLFITFLIKFILLIIYDVIIMNHWNLTTIEICWRGTLESILFQFLHKFLIEDFFTLDWSTQGARWRFLRRLFRTIWGARNHWWVLNIVTIELSNGCNSVVRLWITSIIYSSYHEGSLLRHKGSITFQPSNLHTRGIWIYRGAYLAFLFNICWVSWLVRFTFRYAIAAVLTILIISLFFVIIIYTA